MGTLTLTLPDGRSGTLSVGDEFASMSEPQRADFISHVQGQLAPHPSFSADVQGGLHDLGTAVSQGARSLGFDSVGKGVESITPDEPAGQSAYSTLTGDLKAGNYRQALSDIPHAALRALPSAAPILAGGYAGGPLLAGAAAAGEALGPTAYSRAANSGRAAPTTRDVVESLPNVAAQGVLGSVLPGETSIANPILRAGAKVALQGAAGAGMDVANQIGSSAGTDKGVSVDPYEAASSGLAQATIGAARGGRELAQTGIQKGAENVMSRTIGSTGSPEGDASVVRIGNMIKAEQASAPTVGGQSASDLQAANSVKQALNTRLTNFAMSLRDAGYLDRDAYRSLASDIDSAYRHNNTVSDGTFQRLTELALPDDAKAYLTEGVRDLNTVSGQSFQKNTTGPFTKLGSVVGKGAAIAGAVQSGSPVAVGLSLVGTPMEGKVGSLLGNGVDRMLGTAQAPVTLQQLAAARSLRAVGIDPDNITPTPQPGVRDSPAIQAAAAALKARQLDAMEKQRGTQNAQTDAAFESGRPTAPEADAYLSGKLNDPSLLPGRPLTTAQELALQNQRVANAATLARTQAAQGKLFGKAAGSDADSIGQTQINRAALRNAASLAAAGRDPQARPDVPIEAVAAAKRTALKRAQAILGKTEGSDVTGSPPDAVPVNTPIRGGAQAPTAPALPSSLTVNTPADVRQAVATDDMVRKQAPAALQTAQASPPPTPAAGSTAAPTGPQSPGMTYLSRGRPDLSPALIEQALRQHEAIGTVRPGFVDSLLSGNAPLPRDLLAQLHGLLPPSRLTKGANPGTDASGVRNPLSYAANLRQEQGAYDSIPEDLRPIADAIRNPELNRKTKAGRRALLDLAKSLHANPARLEQNLGPLTGYGQK